MDGGVDVDRNQPPGRSVRVSPFLLACYHLMERKKWTVFFFACLLLACIGDRAVAGECSSVDTGTMTAWTGTIKTANFGISYNNNQNCSWNIVQSLSNKVKISILSFHLEPQSGGMCYDYLQVFDGVNKFAPEIGKYCGSLDAFEITSTGPSLHLVFFTDNTHIYKGFYLNYTGICGGLTIDVPVDAEGQLESPQFPSAYPASISCSWMLRTDPGYRIDMQLTSLALSSADNCSLSSLQVFDGSDSTDSKLEEFCGSSEWQPELLTQVVSSTDNVVSLHFQGAAEPAQGFRLVYTTEMLACTMSPCQNGGTCTNVDLDFTCQCVAGWTGKACDVNHDDCADWPCGERGTSCEDLLNGFLCSCVAGYQGERCDVDTNECASNPCQNGATCLDAIDEYSCACTAGFAGTHCGQVNPCGLVPCQNEANCAIDGESYICTCLTGYQGQHCEIDVNECGSSPCQHDGTCFDRIDSYECLCLAGYEGINCDIDIDECASSPCQHGTCTDGVDGYICSCIEGYEGPDCQTDIDECASSPCQHGTCTDGVDGYICSCIEGYEGPDCQTDIDECASSPCQHGTCTDGVDGYICSCIEGYEGPDCQTDIDECASSPCQHGTCTDGVDGYICSCIEGYEGPDCQTDIDECASSPCQHGTCTDVVDAYICSCIEGYEGQDCQTDVDECNSGPCLNGAVCVDDVNGYTCDCPEGFRGTHCEEDINECGSDPCMNGATCLDATNHALCQCAAGFTGTLCEAAIFEVNAMCEGGADGIEGSGLVWDDTEPGHMNVKPCPEGITGNASRWCDMTAEWINLDLSQCVSPAFAEISGKAALLKSGNASAADVLELANSLQNVTQIAGSVGGEGATIYPGDVDVAVNSLSVISEVIGSVEDLDVDIAKDLTKACVGTVNNVVDESQLQTWKITGNLDKIGPSVTSLIGTTETIAAIVGQQQTKAMGSADSPAEEDTVLAIKEKNLEIEIAVFPSNGTGEGGPFMGGASAGAGEGGLGGIQLPGDLLSTVQTGNTSSPAFVGVMTGKFTSVGDLFNLASDFGENETRKGYVNTDVLSLKVLGLAEKDFQNLTSPVFLVFKHKEPIDITTYANTSCVFLNMSARSSDERWSDFGCTVQSSNETHTICACSHLTNFAILMDVHGTQDKLNEGHQKALSILSYIGGTLSIMGCIFSIVIYKFFRLKSDRICVHMNLAGAIAMAQLIFLVGIERNEIAWVCKMIAVVLHYSLTAMFCWMLVEGIQLYLALVLVFGSSSHIKKYLLLGWGAPVVIVGISFGAFFKDYATGNVCWLSHTMLLIVFVPTVALLVILNTIVLIIVLKVMMTSLTAREKSKDSDTSQIKTGLKAALVLLPLLGLTWVFGFLSVSEHTVVFTYLFAVCNSLQGLFFFIAHCLMNIEVKKAYQRRYGRKKQMHSMTTSTVPFSSRTQTSLSKRRQSDASTTELTKASSPVNTVSGGQVNSAMKDTCLDKDLDKPKDNSMNNSTDLITDPKKMACGEGIKVNDIQPVLKNSGNENDEEKGLVNGAKVAMETIVSKNTNLKTDGTNLA